MKTQGFQTTGIMLAAATFVAISMPNIFAQDATNAFGQYEMPSTAEMPANTAPETPNTQPAVSTTPLSAADMQILQLTQAKISDSTIITFIQNSTTVYGLDASQIVYLKQQGVSEGVINAMLNQRTAVAAAAQLQQEQQQQQQQQQQPQQYQPGTDQSSVAQPQYVVAQPSTPAPATTVVVPQTVYYPSSPTWSVSWGFPVGWWGWGWGWGGRGFCAPSSFHGNSFHGSFHSGFNSGFHAGFHAAGGFHR